MKISIKLKHTELLSLVALFQQSLHPMIPSTRQEAINATLMVKLYEKLNQKVFLIEPRKYKFSIGIEYAMAFIEFFGEREIDISGHAGNTVRRLIADFDKDTTTFFRTKPMPCL